MKNTGLHPFTALRTGLSFIALLLLALMMVLPSTASGNIFDPVNEVENDPYETYSEASENIEEHCIEGHLILMIMLISFVLVTSGFVFFVTSKFSRHHFKMYQKKQR